MYTKFSKSMKIITLNCANYDDHPDWLVRKSMIADQIVEFSPDVVCLQEIRFDPSQAPTNTDYLNMGEQIVEELNSNKKSFEIFFSLAQYYDHLTYVPSSNPTSIYEGLGILTVRNNTIEQKLSTIYLPMITTQDQNRRITQHIQFNDVDLKQIINVFNVHFSFDETDLQSNIKCTLDYCAQFKQNIIVGDMNNVYDQIKKPFEDSGYIDLWKLMHPDENGFTFPSNSPLKRIDYCWISSDLLNLCSVKQIITILSYPNANGVYASDHLGLFIELTTNKQINK